MKKFLMASTLFVLMVIGFVGCKQVSTTNPQETPLPPVEKYEVDETGVLIKYNGNESAIVLPDTVKSIKQDVFKSSSGLTSVTIGAGLTSLDNLPLDSNQLKEINVSGSNATYKAVNGVLYSQDGTTLYKYPPAKQGSSVTIPDDVTSIGDGAFSSCSGLTRIIIHKSVSSIGNDAFKGCTNAKIYIPTAVVAGAKNKGVDDQNIIETTPAKYNMSGSTVTGYNGTKPSGIIVLPDTVTEIGANAFSGCTGLTSVIIPDSLTSIGASAFNTSGLTSIDIPNNVTSIGASAFAGCASLTSVSIPNSVKSIGTYAFSNCSKLTSITLSNTITELSEGIFAGCGSLASITVPDSVTSIATQAFTNCSALTTVTIGSGVTSITSPAFWGCSALTTVYVPSEEIKTIVEGAGVSSSKIQV